jgi:hypothetical protein
MRLKSRRTLFLGGGGCVAACLDHDDEIGRGGAVTVEYTAEAEILGFERQAVLKIDYVLNEARSLSRGNKSRRKCSVARLASLVFHRVPRGYHRPDVEKETQTRFR